MKINKHNLWFLVLFINLSILSKSSALTINFIDYDPPGGDTDKEWFELCNDGPLISNFANGNYKAITQGSSSYSSHDIKPEYSSGSVDLPADTCAAIVDDVVGFKNYKPDYINPIFDSSFTLTNTGGYVGIVEDKNILICKSYGTGACPNDSNSDATSTNSTSTNSTTSSTTNTSNNTSIIYVYVPTNNQNKYGDIQVLLPSEKVVPALADVDYTVKAVDSQRNVINGLDFDWSFGDGGEKFGKDVSYHYVYPGQYTLIATADGYTSGGQARMNVEVVTPDIFISKVGTSKIQNYIDLENKTNYDLFLSNFYLNVDSVFYKLPKNLIIAKNKTIHLSGEALGFTLPARFVSLHYPNKSLLTSYSYIYTATTSTSSIILSTTTEKIITEEPTESKNLVTENNIVNKLTQSHASTEEKINKFNSSNVSDILNLKRLILSNDSANYENKSKNTSFTYNKEENINSQAQESKNVDTGIINWIKNLIY